MQRVSVNIEELAEIGEKLQNMSSESPVSVAELIRSLFDVIMDRKENRVSNKQIIAFLKSEYGLIVSEETFKNALSREKKRRSLGGTVKRIVKPKEEKGKPASIVQSTDGQSLSRLEIEQLEIERKRAESIHKRF